MSQTTTRRYRFLLGAGDSLLTAQQEDHDVEELLCDRLVAWQAATGMSVEDTVVTPLLTVPLPLYVDLGPEPAPGQYDSRRAFPHVHPEALRNPLFWLPPYLAERQRFGDDVVEEQDAWALRVALVLTEAGLYHPGYLVEDESGTLTFDQSDEAAGTWVDVLSLVGLDPADPDDCARIVDWQNGAFDPALDSINLAGETDVQDRDWALEHSDALLPVLRQVTWARLADDIAMHWSWLLTLRPALTGSPATGGVQATREDLLTAAYALLERLADGDLREQAGKVADAVCDVLRGVDVDPATQELVAQALGEDWRERALADLPIVFAAEVRRMLGYASVAVGNADDPTTGRPFEHALAAASDDVAAALVGDPAALATRALGALERGRDVLAQVSATYEPARDLYRDYLAGAPAA